MSRTSKKLLAIGALCMLGVLAGCSTAETSSTPEESIAQSEDSTVVDPINLELCESWKSTFPTVENSLATDARYQPMLDAATVGAQDATDPDLNASFVKLSQDIPSLITAHAAMQADPGSAYMPWMDAILVVMKDETSLLASCLMVDIAG
jgi:hypothetical protein